MHDIDHPGVLFVKTPRNTPAPLVLDSPHSGTSYPDDFHHVSDFMVLRRAEDTYIHELYADAPDHGALLMGAHFPRSYIDVNRGLEEIDTSIMDGNWDGPVTDSEKATAGIGLIWRVNQLNDAIYNRKLSVEEVKNRIANYWQVYHSALNGALEETHRAFGKVIHLNCHSMPEISNESSKEGPGVRRPEFCLGDRQGTTCAPELTDFVRTALIDLGYQVAVNEPYAGVELVKAYSDPATEKHSLQIEIRRDLYMNELTLKKNANFDALKADLASFTRKLSDFSRSF